MDVTTSILSDTVKEWMESSLTQGELGKEMVLVFEHLLKNDHKKEISFNKKKLNRAS